MIRIAVYGVAIVVPILFLLLQRIFTAVPFFPSKDYRCYTVVNKKDFLDLYELDELPSKAPIEGLSGKACPTYACTLPAFRIRLYISTAGTP